MSAISTVQERERTLEQLDILDTEPEVQFDRVTRIAARIFGVPVAQINFFDRERQWSKSSVGTDEVEYSREKAICRRALERGKVTVLTNLQESEEFSTNPLVKGEPYVDFYAGVPLITSEDVAIGTVCIMDTEKRSWSAEDTETLQDLAQIVVDELELRHKGRAIQESERHYRRLFEESRDAILLTTPDGSFVDVNPATVDLFGYSRDEFMDMNARELYVNPERRETYQRRMEENGSVRDFEVTLRRKNGKEIACLVTATARRDEYGNVEAYQDIIRDVTERKKKERQIILLNRILRHDIRNEANVIIAWASRLYSEVPEETRQYLGRIERASQHVVDLSDSTRLLMETIIGEDAVPLEPTNVSSVLENEIQKARTSHEAVEFDFDDNLPEDLEVRANSMLSSVFGNVLNNAVRHNDKDVPYIEVTTAVDGDEVEVRVADNGPGVPETQKEEIFGKGRKGLESPGMGIGLYLVNTLVEQFGGEIWVEDNEPEGAVFVIRLPLFNGRRSN